MGASVWTAMGLVNALQATQDSTVSLVGNVTYKVSHKRFVCVDVENILVSLVRSQK